MASYVEGYKAFENDFTNRHGVKFDVNQNYHIDGIIKAGKHDAIHCGNGFHICVHPEHTFRYVSSEPSPILCEVIGFGDISEELFDEYYGDYGIYACSDIYIKRIVPRKEIIEMVKTSPEHLLSRFIATYKMTDAEALEIERELSPYSYTLRKSLDYYHYGNKDAFK